MYLLACIVLSIYFIKSNGYVIIVGDVSLTDAHPITSPDPNPVPNSLLLKYIYTVCY